MTYQAPSDLEDAEIAACMAGIFAYIRQEEEELAAACGKQKPTINSWLAAARLEQTGRAHSIAVAPANRDNLWRAATRAVLSAILCISLSSASLAQDAPATEPQRKPIRIGLCVNSAAMEIAIPDGAQIRDASSGNVLATVPPQTKWHLAAGSGIIAWNGTYSQPGIQPAEPTIMRAAYTPSTAGASRMTLPLPSSSQAPLAVQQPRKGEQGYIVVPPSDESVFALNGKLYRGLLWLQKSRTTAGALTAVNVIDLEDYLLSVLPSEMPSNWPVEALRAQAIAARSYAVANIGKHEADGYDLKANVEDQVYSGISSETDACNKAVADTTGIVIKHQDKVVTAFFHSASGGCTEVSENVWNHSLPYLQSVPDYDDASPNFSWTRNFGTSRLEANLAAAGIDIGDLLGTVVVARSPSQRAKMIMFTGSKGVRFIDAGQLRKILQLPSTNFSITSSGENYVIAGRGSGHGLGLSQWGARSLAEQGYNAAQILAYYYKDVSLGYF